MPRRYLPLNVTRVQVGTATSVAMTVGLLTPFLTNHLGLTLLMIPVALLPVVSHVRWVGIRDGITEPSVATVVVIFYVFVFPLRALAVTLTDFTAFELPANSIDTDELVSVLVLASLGTAAIVEGYHCARRWRSHGSEDFRLDTSQASSVAILAVLLGVLSIGALAQILIEQGGLTAAKATFLAHGKSSQRDAGSIGTSIWATTSVPAVWCAAVVAFDGAKAVNQRVAAASAVGLILVAQLIVFGSRLSALLAVLGIWAVVNYSGRRLSPRTIVLVLALGVLVSLPVLEQRSGAATPVTPASERVSEITGYGILDAALAVHQAPESVEAQLDDSQRWLDLPFYLVPRFLWPNRPDLLDRRLDVYVAKTFGTGGQKDSGFPSTFVSEIWLYGDWPLVLGVGLLIGSLVGVAHEAILRPSRRHSAVALVWYCFLLDYAFTFYKDGDVVMTVVGATRNAIYLGGAMLVAAAGTWLLNLPSPASKRPSSPLTPLA